MVTINDEEISIISCRKSEGKVRSGEGEMRNLISAPHFSCIYAEKVREARSVSLITHCWPDVKAHSGKLRQNVRFVPEADSESIRLPVSDRRKNCHACPQRVKDYQVVSKMAV